MPFNVRLKFTGICALVPDLKMENVCILLPYADVEDATGADGNSLRRHRAFVQYNVADLASNPSEFGDGTTAIWYLAEQDLKFGCDGTTSPAGNGVPAEVAKLEAVCASYADYAIVDPALLPPHQPPPLRLAARIVVPIAGLYTYLPTGPWLFPNVLCQKPYPVQQLANELAVEIIGASYFKLEAVPFDGRPTSVLSLTTADYGWVDLTIANLCEDNPLRWDVEDPELLPDTDFRWHFELLHPHTYENLNSFLKGEDLPFPLPAGEPNGLGRNCFLVVTKEQDWRI